MSDLMEAQKAIEQEGVVKGIARYRKLIAEGGHMATNAGQRAMSVCLEAFPGAIRAFIDEAKAGKPGRGTGLVHYMDQFDVEALAFVTANVVLTMTAKHDALMSQAAAIAGQLEDHLNYQMLSEEAPALFKQLLFKLKSATGRRRHVLIRVQQEFAGLQSIVWGRGDAVRLGVTLLELMQQSTGMLTIDKVHSGKKSTNRVRLTAETAAWLEKSHGFSELLYPVLMPMIVPPNPWASPIGGGYLTYGRKFPLISGSPPAGFLEELKSWEMPAVYKAVNAIQKTPWAINRAVLDVASAVWEEGAAIGKMPSRSPKPMPPKTFVLETMPNGEEIVDPEALKLWKKQAAKLWDENIHAIPKRLSTDQKVAMAKRFSVHEAIWFPHRMDWRGRIYCASEGLNPQGDDLSRSLLQFRDGIALGENGMYWLAVHGSNCFGNDKVAFEDRVAWVQDNHEAIIECATNPLDGSRWWSQASSPWQFLAFCMEWLGASIQGQEYESRLPVAWDGSCNGLQNFSAMLRDPVGGAATNLVPSDKPSDIYSLVAAATEKLVALDAARGDERAQKWIGKVTRNIAKRPTMTLPYGATIPGFRDQTLAELKKIKEETGKDHLGTDSDMFGLCHYIATTMHTAIGTVVIAAREAMDWLKAVSKLVSAEGMPLHWVAPSGMLVRQDYRLSTSTRVDFKVLGRRYQVNIGERTTKLDSRKQGLGVAPNFVHSMDAAHLVATVNACVDAGIEDFAMIHDSYGTHAANADALGTLLRECFIEQYSGNVLEDLRSHVISQLSPELAAKVPPIPTMGDLDLTAIHQSGYFFA